MNKALDENDANEVGDGGTSDAEGDGYECFLRWNERSGFQTLVF